MGRLDLVQVRTQEKLTHNFKARKARKEPATKNELRISSICDGMARTRNTLTARSIGQPSTAQADVNLSRESLGGAHNV
jgi:hypothetical protein